MRHCSLSLASNFKLARFDCSQFYFGWITNNFALAEKNLATFAVEG